LRPTLSPNSASSNADLSNFATKGDVAGLQSQINRLGKRDDELTEGLAAVVALAQPILRSGQHFGVSAGWGGYADVSAIGFSAAGVLADNLLRPGSGTLALYGGLGVGTSEGGWRAAPACRSAGSAHKPSAREETPLKGPLARSGECR
jgi:hypothetical protein